MLYCEEFYRFRQDQHFRSLNKKSKRFFRQNEYSEKCREVSSSETLLFLGSMPRATFVSRRKTFLFLNFLFLRFSHLSTVEEKKSFEFFFSFFARKKNSFWKSSKRFFFSQHEKRNSMAEFDFFRSSNLRVSSSVRSPYSKAIKSANVRRRIFKENETFS